MLVLLLNLHVSAAALLQTVQIKSKGVAVRTVLKELKKQTGFYIMFNEKDIDKNLTVAVDIQDASLEQALDAILEGLPLQYNIVDDYVLITHKPKEKAAPRPQKQEQEQKVKLQGVVTDDKGEPLPFAAIRLKDTTIGTISDVNGEFTFEFDRDKGAVIEVSSMGYITRDIPYEGQLALHVSLETSVSDLNEVVVVAYGTRKKGTITGSVSTVKADKMENIPAASFDQALQGQAPGLMVTSNSGEPSKAAVFQIRGTNSLSSGTAPLFILDGLPISSADFNAISPNDIESISVLKDASSTSIYGARAANGVVVITTRRGRESGGAKVTARAQLGFSNLAQNDWTLMNTAERIQYEKEIGMDAGQDYDALSQIDINWLDMVFNNNAPLRNYELSVNEATEKSNYFISGGYYDQEGIATGSNFTRYNFRANMETKAKQWLKLGTNTMMAYEEIEQADEGQYALYTPISATRFMLPYWNPYQEDGSLASESDGSWKGTGQNPLEWMQNNPLTYKKYKAISTFFAELSPVEGLVIRSQLGADFSHTTGYMQSFPSYSPNNGSGSAGRNSSDILNLTITNTVNYRFKADDIHAFNFMVGQEGVDYHSEAFQVVSRGQTNDQLTNVSSGTRASSWGDSTSEYSYMSFFGRGEYNYDSRYFVDLSVRSDASSRFGKAGRWATFWSVGLMWNMMQENFMANNKWLSNAQLSLSTGTSGNSAIPNYDHLALVGGGLNYGGESGIAPLQRGNESLGWEQLWVSNLALHLGFLNRINLDVELYNKRTTNMLMEVPVSMADGGFGYRWDNVGAMVNRGVEVAVNAAVLRTKDFNWNVNANISYNHNEITELYNGLDEYEISSTGTKFVVGHSANEFYINRYAGVNPVNGDALWYTKDGEITNEYSESDKVMIGKSFTAPWQGGFGTALSWKGLTLSGQFSWVWDRWMFNNDRFFEESNGLYAAYNQSERLLYDRWKNPGDLTDIPRHGVAPQMDSRFLEDASFLRLKNVSLSYSLPEKYLAKTKFFSAARVYAQGQNLWTLTKFSGLDPESTSNVYKAQYPASRQFTLGLEVSF
ncbi:TonB-dependent receptor [Mangrovibacterium marinum]|nr:TonB-dependent receptor [Mangrovibacterium marinum]